MTNINVVNESTVVSNEELQRYIPALQTQLNRDLPLYWDTAESNLTLNGGSGWECYIFDDSDQAGALGYHEDDVSDHPIAKIFAKTTLQYHQILSVTISHELLELKIDPYINVSVLNTAKNALYCQEIADAVQSDEFAYEINGVKVSDFVTPYWFSQNPVPLGTRFDFGGHVSKPFMIASGGYIGYLSIGQEDKGWQIEADAKVNIAEIRSIHRMVARNRLIAEITDKLTQQA